PLRFAVSLRSLRFLGLHRQAALFFVPGGRPGPRRRLRRRRTVFGFAATALCAIFSATAFGGRPGPPGRHFPRALRRRRRPFFALGFVPETLPSSDWMAEPTSCCTISLMTVTRLLRLGIVPPFGYRSTHLWRQSGKRPWGYRLAPVAQRHSGCKESGGGWVGQRD